MDPAAHRAWLCNRLLQTYLAGLHYAETETLLAVTVDTAARPRPAAPPPAINTRNR